MTRQSLVLWLGDHKGRLLDGLDREVVGAVGVSLAQLPRNIKAHRRARRELGLGVLCDVEGWRRQLPPEHPGRLAWDGTTRVYRPTARLLSSAAAAAVAEAALEAQQRAHPTVFTTPGHYVQDSDDRVSRQNDLAIAEASVATFADGSLHEPEAGDRFHLRRHLYATVLVDAQRLTPASARWLVDAYAGLPVNGILLWAVNFNEGKRQALLLLDLAEALEAGTGRPVIAAGLWHWHVNALARGLAATCTGPQRLKLSLLPPMPPDVEPAADDEDAESPGRATHIYHRPILGCFGLRKVDQLKAQLAFRRHPCPCGHHDEATPPSGGRERVAHNEWALMQDARVAFGDSDMGRLGRAVRIAAAEREALRMSSLSGCWSATRALADAERRSA